MSLAMFRDILVSSVAQKWSAYVPVQKKGSRREGCATCVTSVPADHPLVSPPGGESRTTVTNSPYYLRPTPALLVKQCFFTCIQHRPRKCSIPFLFRALRGLCAASARWIAGQWLVTLDDLVTRFLHQPLSTPNGLLTSDFHSPNCTQSAQMLTICSTYAQPNLVVPYTEEPFVYSDSVLQKRMIAENAVFFSSATCVLPHTHNCTMYIPMVNHHKYIGNFLKLYPLVWSVNTRLNLGCSFLWCACAGDQR